MEFMLRGARHRDENHRRIRAFLLLSWFKTTPPDLLYHDPSLEGYPDLGEIAGLREPLKAGENDETAVV